MLQGLFIYKFSVFHADIIDTFLWCLSMQRRFWLLTILKTHFLGVFSLIPIYTWKGLYIDCYGRISYVCNNFSLNLFLLFLNILYLGILKVKQCICKLCFESGTDRLEWICLYSLMTFYLDDHFLQLSCYENWSC